MQYTYSILGNSKATESMQMFAKELTQAGHTRRFTIAATGTSGWELRVEHDSQVLRRVCYTDWHRVERALSTIAAQVSELEQDGWRDAPGS